MSLFSSIRDFISYTYQFKSLCVCVCVSASKAKSNVKVHSIVVDIQYSGFIAILLFFLFQIYFILVGNVV